MKPELTPELKERFFALYWGQKVADYKDSYTVNPVTVSPEFHVSANGWLVLRPLSDLTDEEAIEVAKCAGELVLIEAGQKMYFSVERKRNLITVKEKYHSEYVVIDTDDGEVLTYDEDLTASVNSVWAYQKMISKGFALPFMGHSVDDLIEAGWVKLKTKN